MKELFSKAKLDKLRNIFWVLLIMGCHIIYYWCPIKTD